MHTPTEYTSKGHPPALLATLFTLIDITGVEAFTYDLLPEFLDDQDLMDLIEMISERIKQALNEK